MGIIIHSLESVSFKDLYAAFSSAFKDYDFSLNADELRRMLDRRGYNPQLSFGAFFEGRLSAVLVEETSEMSNQTGLQTFLVCAKLLHLALAERTCRP